MYSSTQVEKNLSLRTIRKNPRIRYRNISAVSHVRDGCNDAICRNVLVYCMILILRVFFTPNTKMLELMDEDAQLKKPLSYSLYLYVSMTH